MKQVTMSKVLLLPDEQYANIHGCCRYRERTRAKARSRRCTLHRVKEVIYHEELVPENNSFRIIPLYSMGTGRYFKHKVVRDARRSFCRNVTLV